MVSSFIAGGIFTCIQDTDVPPGEQFKYSHRCTINTTTTSNDYGSQFTQQIEGYNVSDFNWGTTSGSYITLSFWTKVTGISNGTILPIKIIYYAGSNYSINLSYTVANSGNWQYVVLIIPPPPTAAGVSSATNTLCLSIIFPLSSSGQGSQQVLNTWAIYNGLFRIIGGTDLASTSGWVRWITGVQLEKGTVATPFEVRPYPVELQLCQRYYEQVISYSNSYSLTYFSAGGSGVNLTVPFKVTKRATPSIANGTVSGVSCTAAFGLSDNTLFVNVFPTAAAVQYFNIAAPVNVTAEL